MLRAKVKRFLASEDGPSAVEYAVMLALILGLAIGSLGLFGASAGGVWTNNSTEIENAMGAS